MAIVWGGDFIDGGRLGFKILLSSLLSNGWCPGTPGTDPSTNPIAGAAIIALGMIVP